MKRGCDLNVFTECELTKFFTHCRIEELNKIQLKVIKNLSTFITKTLNKFII